MEFNVTLKANDGRMVSMAAQQANAIQEMNNTRKAGFASVTGYVPTTGYDVSPVQNIQIITHIRIDKLYERRLEALEAVEFKDVAPFLAAHEKLAALSVNECIALFNERKQKEIDSLKTSLSGNRSDNHRQAHDRCYAHFGDVKVHLVTEGKPKEPVTDSDGNVQLASIMVPYIELNVTEVKKGKRKVINSGTSVLMKNLITKAMNKRSIVFKTLSLKADNFESFKVDGKKLLAEDVARFGDIIKT